MRDSGVKNASEKERNEKYEEKAGLKREWNKYQEGGLYCFLDQPGLSMNAPIHTKRCHICITSADIRVNKKNKKCCLPLLSITFQGNNIILHGMFTLCSDFNIFNDDTTMKIVKT